MAQRVLVRAALGAALVCGVARGQAVAEPALQPAALQPAAAGMTGGDHGYVAAGQRDPFRPFTLDLRAVREPKGPVTPLQRYEIGQLTLAGVVLGIDPPRAMVEDSIGMGYIVTIGTPVGRNGGVVRKISAGGVTVEERMLDFFGREQVKEVRMTLPSDDGGEEPEKKAREQR